ncbi:MAG: hypothetical protein J7D60_09035 [Prosthecochloris sp.]|nr:hypothetical protein [Prosthecochloris sp.]
MTDNKRIVKNTALLYIRMVVLMFVGFMTSRIVLDKLGVTDYGIYDVVGGIAVLLVFFSGTLSSAVSRFLVYEIAKKDHEEVKKVYRSSVTIHLVFGIGLLIVMESGGLWFLENVLVIPSERIQVVGIVYQFVVLGALLKLVQLPVSALMIAHEDMQLYSYVGMFDAVLRLGLVFFIDAFRYDNLLVYGFIVLLVSMMSFLVYNISAFIRYKEYSVLPLYDKYVVSKMMNFVGWGVIGGFASIMKTQGLNMLLNVFFGPSINAARGVSYQVNNGVGGLTQNFIVALSPQITKSYASRDFGRMKKLVYRGAKYSFYLLLLLSLPLLFEVDYILGLWLTDVPDYASVFTRLIIIQALVESFNPVLYAAVQATGKIKIYQLIVGGTLLVNLPLSVFLFWSGLEPQSCFILSIGISLISLFLRFVLLSKMRLNFCFFDMVKNIFLMSLVVAILSVPIPYLVNHYIQPGMMRFALVVMTSMSTVMLLVWFVGLREEERQSLQKILPGRGYSA